MGFNFGLTDVGVEFTHDILDADVAAYVHGVLPPPWGSRCDVRAIEIALERVRLGSRARNIDECVRSALSGLGIPVDPSTSS
jgi:hypothetical protein